MDIRNLRFFEARHGAMNRAAMELVGWGGRTRTSEWRNQNPLPYHLATPHQAGLLAPPRRADHSGRNVVDQRRWTAVVDAIDPSIGTARLA
jgi:hypothetical protein